MKINYNLNSNSSCLNAIKAPYVWGTRHIALACNSNINIHLLERIGHFVFGLLLLLPPFNLLLAFIDGRCNFNAFPYKIVHLNGSGYEMGKRHGELFKEDIQELYANILPVYKYLCEQRKIPIEHSLEQIKQNLSEPLLKEMEGLAAGAEVPLEDVLLINLSFELLGSGHFACSAMGVIQNLSKNLIDKVATTNHFQSLPSDNIDSTSRLEKLMEEDPNNEKLSCKRKLREVDKNDTIQSIIFDVVKGKIQLSSQEEFSASGSFASISTANLFKESHFSSSKEPIRIKLARNLDYPMGNLLAKRTTVFVHHTETGHEFITIGFPGLITPLSGMNNHGVAFALCSSANNKAASDASPTCLFLREGLHSCKTMEEVLENFKDTPFATSMNLVVAAQDGIGQFEIDPQRAKKGAAQGFVAKL